MKRTDLERLAEALETRVPADRFDMARWWASDCGCAIGWGDELDVLPTGLTLEPQVFDHQQTPVLAPTLGEIILFEALAVAYDIDLDTTYHLFNDETYYDGDEEDGYLNEGDEITPQHVAARIREVLAR